jgi:hypothetical protein
MKIRKRSIVAGLFIFLALAGFVSFLVVRNRMLTPLPLGPETSFVMEPLDSEGYVDYQAALNRHLSQGIPPAKNAVVVLCQVLGPRPEGATLAPTFYELLGCPEPPAEGAYFVNMNKFGNEKLGLDDERTTDFFKASEPTFQRAWDDKAHPRVAAWLAANEKPLALVREAVQRPDYYYPLVCPVRPGEPSSLIGALLPGVQKCRELATALTTRAMSRLGKGQYDVAWQDLQDCHRLGRLVSRGGTLIELLVGIAIDQVATAGDLAYLEKAPLTSEQIRSRMDDLRKLAPLSHPAEKMNNGERMMCLQTMQLAKRYGPGIIENISGGSGAPPTPSPLGRFAMGFVSWRPVMESANAWYNRIVETVKIEDPRERKKELDGFDADLKALRVQSTQWSGKSISEKVGDIMICLLMPALRKVQDAYDRSQQVQLNLQVAFALAAYKADNGHYPSQLAALAPKYLRNDPLDLFSGKPLQYTLNPDGYFFYSIGVNCKDEKGQAFGDEPPGDDLPVRMPLPPLKKE